MNKKLSFLIVYSLIFILLSSCLAGTKNESDKNKTRGISDIFKKERLSKDLYNAVWGKQVDWVREILATPGIDSNFCKGECGWLDSNPLGVLAERIDNTYTYYGDPEPVTEPLPSVSIVGLLVGAGADINKRPYVWDMVYFYDNGVVDRVERYRKQSNKSMEREDINDQVRYFVSDVNRLLRSFLETGADPDKLGHPYPYSAEAMYAGIDDRKANEYFSQGTRAINEAIKKGILWESQVDLLLQYTKLDEDSLIAAEESGDPLMVEKINKLWDEQQKANQ